MRRRDLIGLVGVAALGVRRVARAQGRPWRIGVMLPEHRVADREPLLAALRDVGLVEGRDIVVEVLLAPGAEGAERNAAELVRRRVDVIIAYQTPQVTAAKRATTEIPIVFSAGDPVGTGLVASLARPGGNLTGWSGTTAEIGGKRLELLREALPALRRVALLIHQADPFAVPFREQMEAPAQGAGIAILPLLLSQPDEIEAAFATLRRDPPDAAIVQPSLPLSRAGRLALAQRLPAMSEGRNFVAAGGLMSFAASASERFQHVARYVDRILKGARPADLPVVQPTQYELVLNLKTAVALGLAIPPALLARADEVIE
jgi:putative tryptophan/tyrosine transport system substrate-binding protein